MPLALSQPASLSRSRRLTHRGLIRRITFTLAATVLSASGAQATCWLDPALTQMAVRLSQQLMPELQKVPQVQVCTDEHFPELADGLYTSGVNVIQFKPRAVGGAAVHNLLIHELAHALVAQQYGPQTFANGHGPEWMRLMVRLGRVDDARFHASVYPEAMPAFQQAVAGLGDGTRWAGPSSPPPTYPPPMVRPTVPPQTTMAIAEAELRSVSCAHVLLVPSHGGVHGYVLGAFFPAFIQLPLASGRVQSVRWARPGVLEVVTHPTPDGTPSLLCLR